MTGADRQHLKQLVDYHRRQRIQAEDAPFQPARCRGCGGELEGRVIGCKVCQDRHINRKRLQDPEFRRREAEARARRHHRRRQVAAA